MSDQEVGTLSESDRTNLALSYATLLCVDAGEGVACSGENLKSILDASNININETLLNVYARAVQQVGEEELESFLQVGGGGGNAGNHFLLY